jgi:hypothetical protein
MRKVEIETTKYTQVFATDERGAGNANHIYSVASVEAGEVLQVVCFQNGPIKESGVNGVMNEDLIAMVIDRLEGFQSSKFACRENALAISCLEWALLWLRERTTDREVRGVEGTNEV